MVKVKELSVFCYIDVLMVAQIFKLLFTTSHAERQSCLPINGMRTNKMSCYVSLILQAHIDLSKMG